MTTREAIIETADELIRDKGYNAFSFKDISNKIGIKTASIHYHFPTKGALGLATVNYHIQNFEVLKEELKTRSPLEKLHGFLSIYCKVKEESKICIVGSLASGFNAIDEKMKYALQMFAAKVLEWVTEILEEGRQQKIFEFKMEPRAKALLIITNMLAIVQLFRLTDSEDFDIVKNTIIQDLQP